MVRSYDSFTSKYFKNPYNFGRGRVNKDVSSLLYQRLMEEEERKMRRIEGRSNLDRAFDLLLAPNYAIAGLVDGIVRKDRTALDGFVGGLRAGNPFGEGHEEGETTFSDVLEHAGWKPKSTAGKFAKGTVGFALDVLLDPLTYLSGGASALVKGTGRVGKVAEHLTKLANRTDVKNYILSKEYGDMVNRLVNKGVSKERAERFAYKKFWENATKERTATHMTKDMAEAIILNQSKERGFKLTPEELSRDAERFASEYNRLMGIRDVDGGKPITFGLKNLPFGDKIKNADKYTWTLSDGKKVRELSDKLGISHVYSKIRSHIYGKKIGELFSTTAPLWRLAQEDPAKLYDFVKFIEYTKGLNADKLKAEKLIRDKAKAMNFTPAEQKEILQLLQDKTVWSKVKTHLKFAETQKAKEIAEAMRQAITKSQEQVDELLEKRRTVEQLRDAVERKIIDGHKMIDKLDLEHQEALSSVNLDLVQDRIKLEELVNAMKGEIDRIDKKLSELETTNGIPLEELDKLYGEVVEEQLKADEYFKTIEKLQEKKKQVKENKTNTSDQIKTADEVETQFDVIEKAIDDEIMQIKLNKPSMEKRQTLIDTLSQAIFGQTGKLSPTLRGDSLEKLVNMFREGKTAKEVREHIEENAHLYSEHATEVYRYLAQKYGYKSWKETYHEPIQKLKDKLMNGEQLTPWEFQEYLYLQTLRAKRAKDFDKFFNKMTYDEFKEFRRIEANNKLMKDLYDNVNAKLKPHERLELTDEERLAMSMDDFQTLRTDDIPKRIRVGDKVWGGKKYEVYEVETTVELGSGKKKPVTKRRYVDPETGEVFRLERGKMVKTQDEFSKPKLADAEFVPKEKNEILSNSEYAKMYEDAVLHYINAQSRRAGKNLYSAKDILVRGSIKEQIENVVSSMGKLLLENFKGKAYSDLTDKQRDYLIKMAIKHAKNPEATSKELQKLQEAALKEAERRANLARIEAIVDTVKEGYEVTFHDGKRPRAGVVKKITKTDEGTRYTVESRGETFEVFARDVKHVRVNKQSMKPEDLIMNSKITQDYLKEKEELMSKLSEYEKQLADLDGEMVAREKALIKEYRKRAREQKKIIKELEETRKAYDDTLQAIDEDPTLDELIKKIERYEQALVDDDALETFIRAYRGDKYVDNVLHDANVTNSAKYLLHERASSPKVAKMVEILYEEFKKMGEEEVRIGKLSKEQFEAMLGRYVPHILTEDGKRYIDSIKELEPHKSSITRDLGYGLKWNPYAQSRQIEGTIEEINERFRDVLQGKNLFSENVADIYLIRALKHTELMYDHEYMNTMMNVFGKKVKNGVVEDGYKAVVNYGQLKKKIRDIVVQKAKIAKSMGESVDADWFDRETINVLKQFHLPPNILDEIATPMVELSEKQVKALEPLGIVKQVNDAIVMKANQARKLQIAKDQSRFLQLYDKFLHFMKLNQTTVMPSFHIRNKLSNMYLNWLGVGRDALNPRMQRDALKTVYHLGDVEKLKDLKPIVSDDGTKVYHWNELYELAKSHGVIDEGFFAKDIGAGSATKGLISKKFKKIPQKYDPTDTENFILYKKGAEIGTVIENSDRLLHFASLLKQGKTIEEAARSSKTFLFDYSDLTAFEQAVMKRIFPYYTWLRKNGRLQLSQMIEQPEKYRLTAKALNAIHKSNNEEERVEDQYLSDFAKDWVQTPFSIYNERGDKEPILLNPNLPFMDVSRLPDVGQPDSTMRELLAQTAPQIKIPLELATNTNFFFNSPITKEEENPITTKLAHIARQLALYNAGEGFFTKEGVDMGLHALNTFGGVKGLSYDYETSKFMKIREYLDKLKAQEE